jgi:hypothetical protein
MRPDGQLERKGDIERVYCMGISLSVKASLQSVMIFD